MITSYFTYEVNENDFINKCMISDLSEIPYKCIPAPYTNECKVNQLWSEIISPVRTQFLKENLFKASPLSFQPCKNIYFPFQAEKIEYSTFFMQPHSVYFTAEINLTVPKSGEYKFLFSTCGGAKIIVNKKLQDVIYSYLRNQGVTKEITLQLTQGENVIHIIANDLAERDTQFWVKLQYKSKPTITVWLPRTTNINMLKKARGLLSKIHLSKFNFQNKDINIFFDDEVQEDIVLSIKLVFSDAHTKTDNSQKTVTVKKGDTKVYIGDLIYKRVGMANVTVNTKVGDFELSKKIDFEFYDEGIMPQFNIDTIQQRKKVALDFISSYGLDNFQKALALLETGKNQDQAQEIFNTEIYKITQRYDCSDFRTPAFMYAYKSKNFTVTQKEKIREVLLNFRYWFDENGDDVMWFFSENHALNFHASELLAGELFENEVFTNSGLTGKQHQEKAKKLLVTWFLNFFKFGFNEWNSSVYIPIDMIAFFALYDLTKDTQIKQLAKKALDKTFSIFAANGYKGIVAASYGRIYFKNLIGRRTSESSAINFIANKEGYLNQNCFATVLFALSTYEPNESILKMYNVSKLGQEVESCEGEERVQLYSFKTPDYIMGSVYNYHPNEPGTQEHAIQIMVGDCDTQIWINHPGEAEYFGEGRPSYFAGNGTLPLVQQTKNFATVAFDLLEQEVAYTHAFCPLERFNMYALEDKWLFLQKQNTYVAIYAENGIEITEKGALKNYEIISHGRKNLWKVLLETTQNYPDINIFKQYVINNY